MGEEGGVNDERGGRGRIKRMMYRAEMGEGEMEVESKEASKEELRRVVISAIDIANHYHITSTIDTPSPPIYW